MSQIIQILTAKIHRKKKLGNYKNELKSIIFDWKLNNNKKKSVIKLFCLQMNVYPIVLTVFRQFSGAHVLVAWLCSFVELNNRNWYSLFDNWKKKRKTLVETDKNLRTSQKSTNTSNIDSVIEFRLSEKPKKKKTYLSVKALSVNRSSDISKHTKALFYFFLNLPRKLRLQRPCLWAHLCTVLRINKWIINWVKQKYNLYKRIYINVKEKKFKII